MNRKKIKKGTSRRKFLKNGLSLGIGAATTSGVFSSCSKNEQSEPGEKVRVMTTDGKLVEIDASQMHESVQVVSNEEARKGDPNKEYVMVIDLAKCRNARKCVDVCQRMHNLPPEDEWIKVFYMKDSEDSAPYWFPKPCFHCNSPSCVNVCPVGATFKRLDGLVLIDNERCIGCKFCMAACPYSSRVFNWKEQEYGDDMKDHHGAIETGVPQKVGTVGKCDFCPDMARMGKLPGCIDACPNGVMYYGDKNEDLVTNGTETVRFSELIYERAGYRFMEELGTRPSVYYLPPVNRSFDPEIGFKDLPDEIRERYDVTRSKIKKETR
jgi:molybdopterin-containing oxidoreductase family iron-sulfur binding subunit